MLFEKILWPYDWVYENWPYAAPKKKFTGSTDLKISLFLFVCWITWSFFSNAKILLFSGIKFTIDQSFDMITWLSWIAIGVLAVWFDNIGHNISVLYLNINFIFSEKDFSSEKISKREKTPREATCFSNYELGSSLKPEWIKTFKTSIHQKGVNPFRFVNSWLLMRGSS